MVQIPEDISAEKFKEAVQETILESRRNCMYQVDALMDAGWKFELPEIVNNTPYETEPWQWYWRRPAKGNRKKGRLFRSTNQAYNALKRG